MADMTQFLDFWSKVEQKRDQEMKILLEQQTANQEIIKQLLAREIPQLIPGQGVEEVTFKSLMDQMDVFVYDSDKNLTHEAWYDRFKPVFETQTAGWTDQNKIRLLTRMLSQEDYQKFASAILPLEPKDLTLKEAVDKLKRLFGHRQTKFSLRRQFFTLKKEASETFCDYAVRVNKVCEKFDIAQCSADDLKALGFVNGLKDPQDSLILEKLLSKIDAQHVQLEAAADDAVALAAIKKLDLDKLVNEAERLISLKKDKAEVGSSPGGATREIFSVHKSDQRSKQKPDFSSSRPLSPKQRRGAPRPCRFCGGADHWEDDCKCTDRCGTCNVFGHKTGKCDDANKALLSRVDRIKRGNGPKTMSVAGMNDASAEKRKFITPSVNGSKIRLQVDSASDITIISYENFCKLGKPSLVPAEIRPGSASGDKVHLMGKFNCHMQLNDRKKFGTVFVSSRLNLFGIDWINQFDLWNVPLNTVCNSVRKNAADDELTSEVKSTFPALFSEGLGRCSKVKASLALKPDAKAIFRRARPIAFAAAPKVEEEIHRQQHMGVFTPISYSDYAAPIVAAQKKNGKVRICGDYSTGLNEALESNRTPPPTPDSIFSHLSRMSVFSKIDFSDGFLQIELDEASKKLLTVNTHLGLFQINRLQPGIKPAPGIFQDTMNKMLSGVRNAFAFIDDIIVGGTDEKDHRETLIEVLSRIQEYGFKLRADKCEFGKSEILYCGHVVNSRGIKPDPTIIKSINKLPRPKDVSQLRSFLGSANYYGKFVRNITEIRGPLDELTKKDVAFEWNHQHEEAFIKIKEVLSSDLVLTHFDPRRKIVVAADASAYGKGGAIMHEFSDGTLHPIHFFSSTFNAAEKNYSQIDKEATALCYAIKCGHKWLYGRRFELQTDHKPLLSIFGSKEGIPVYTARLKASCSGPASIRISSEQCNAVRIAQKFRDHQSNAH